MTTIALAILAAGLIVALIVRERDHDRAIARLLDTRDLERKDTAKQADRERQMLLNRIKPETAQYLEPDEPLSAPQAVSMFDDVAYYEAQGVSKEELAELAAAEELAR